MVISDPLVTKISAHVIYDLNQACWKIFFPEGLPGIDRGDDVSENAYVHE